ncbi:MAG: DUF1345 domain-containing protein [Hyphomicrobiaceae bacterium]
MDHPARMRAMKRLRRRWYQPRALVRGLWGRPKLIAAAVVAIAVLALGPTLMPMLALWSARAAAGWLAGATVYLGFAVWIMWRCGPEEIRRSAEREDESRFVFLVLIVLAIASSFTAIVALIGDARVAKADLRGIYLGLAGATVLASWLVMQIVYTLHYAHDYYRPNAEGTDLERGLEFPGGALPDYWDFLYFTTSIGATSQTSDVAISSRTLRRQVTVHAVLSFIFNTTILALAINVASGLIGG